MYRRLGCRYKGVERMRKVKGLGTLLLAGALLIGCGGSDTDKSPSKSEESNQTAEVTEVPTKEPTAQPTEEPAKETEEAETDREHEIELPEDQKLVADYTKVDGLIVEKGTRLAFVVKSTETGYWKAVRQGVKQAVDDLNETLGYTEEDKITFTFEGPKTETDVDAQINALDAVVSENPSVLCLAAVDMGSCVAQLEAAQENGIPVIILDSGVDSEELVYSVCATDNYAAGREAAKKLCEKIGDEGEVAIVSHLQVGESSKSRVEGFQDEIAENHPQVEVVQVAYEPQKEGDVTVEESIDAIMKLYPQLKGVFCTNESMGIKALQVLENYADRGIQLVGFDMGPTQEEAIRNGKMAGVVSQNPYGMGYATVVAGVRAILDMENDAFVDAGYQWIDAENIDLEEKQKYLYK